MSNPAVISSVGPLRPVDHAAIRAVAVEQLHAYEAASPQALAEKAGCSVRDLIAALHRYHAVARIAGDGCWWWRLIERVPGEGDAVALAERAADRIARDRARRQALDERERLRGAMMRHPGGATISRLAELTRMGAKDIRAMLAEMVRANAAVAFSLHDIEFYKPIDRPEASP